MRPIPVLEITDHYGDLESHRLIAQVNGIEIDIMSDEDGLCVTVHKIAPDAAINAPLVEFSHDWEQS